MDIVVFARDGLRADYFMSNQLGLSFSERQGIKRDSEGNRYIYIQLGDKRKCKGLRPGRVLAHGWSVDNECCYIMDFNPADVEYYFNE